MSLPVDEDEYSDYYGEEGEEDEEGEWEQSEESYDCKTPYEQYEHGTEPD